MGLLHRRSVRAVGAAIGAGSVCQGRRPPTLVSAGRDPLRAWRGVESLEGRVEDGIGPAGCTHLATRRPRRRRPHHLENHHGSLRPLEEVRPPPRALKAKHRKQRLRKGGLMANAFGAHEAREPQGPTSTTIAAAAWRFARSAPVVPTAGPSCAWGPGDPGGLGGIRVRGAREAAGPRRWNQGGVGVWGSDPTGRRIR